MKKLKHIKNSRVWIGIALLIVLTAFSLLPSIQTDISVPHEVTVFNDQSPDNVPHVDKQLNQTMVQASTEVNSSSAKKKKTDRALLEDLKVVPGGQSIGVQLHTLGVLVVGHHLVTGKEEAVSPGEEAKINVGDVILKINGNAISKMEEVKPYVVKAGEENKKLAVTVKRGKDSFKTTLQPILDKKDDEYKIGLYIRDSAAGIGTMTFYEPKSKKYGALGHVISDMDTKKPIEIDDGTIVRSSVTSIERGNNGVPGEKEAKFSIEENKIGSITKNSPFGIFGKLSGENMQTKGKSDKALPIALSHEVKEGPAKILTVVEDEKVEEFDVEIVSSIPQKFPATKGLVIQITDPELLKKTGGIVQGMSGSPIIQDGKLVGAVTHVFVNDPTSGYGVHIEWMLQDAGVNIYEKEKAS